MAHFARINEDNIVVSVVVVANKDTCDAFGVEKEHIGAAFLENLIGGTWKQTSYNANFRKNYAGIGYSYQADIDAFVPPQPYPSWSLNTETAQWEPPIPFPGDGQIYTWDEDNNSWVLFNNL